MEYIDKDITILLTYRCNARCSMCNCFLNPSNPKNEITLKDIEELPAIRQVTISGGEPFLRNDIETIIDVLEKKVQRVLIMTNGSLTNKIVEVCKQHKSVGIRISLDGTESTNNAIRGIPNGFQKCIELIEKLKKEKINDIGISVTAQDKNWSEIIDLYEYSKKKGIDFTIGVIANSFHYHKNDNEIEERSNIVSTLSELKRRMLSSYKVKNWARAYFIDGLIEHMRTGNRRLDCNAGKDVLFIDPFGNVLPCQGTKEEIILGNIKTDNLTDILKSDINKSIVDSLKNCNRCWTMCNVSNTIRHNKLLVVKWIIEEKLGLKWIHRR